jgi:hypothetical protein
MAGGMAGNPYGWVILAACCLGSALSILIPRRGGKRNAIQRRLAACLGLVSLCLVFLLAACLIAGWQRTFALDILIAGAVTVALAGIGLRFPRAAGIPIVTLAAGIVLTLTIVFSPWARPRPLPAAPGGPLAASGTSAEGAARAIYEVRARGAKDAWEFSYREPPTGGASSARGATLVRSSSVLELKLEEARFLGFYALTGLDERFRIKAEGLSSPQAGLSLAMRRVLSLIGVEVRDIALPSRSFGDFEMARILLIGTDTVWGK